MVKNFMNCQMWHYKFSASWSDKFSQIMNECLSHLFSITSKVVLVPGLFLFLHTANLKKKKLFLLLKRIVSLVCLCCKQHIIFMSHHTYLAFSCTFMIFFHFDPVTWVQLPTELYLSYVKKIQWCDTILTVPSF